MKENLRVMVCCANGAGTSLMIKMTVQKVFDKLNIQPAKIHHCALSEGKGAAAGYDVVLCSKNFANMFDDAKQKGTKVIALRNIMSVDEMEGQLKENGIA